MGMVIMREHCNSNIAQLPWFVLQILKVLNSNTENPYLLWDNATRAELVEFVKDQQQQKIRTVSAGRNQ
jgi:hypothetical protein